MSAPPSLLVFDSGIGGLTVAREIRRELPEARLTYLADTAGFPYGAKPDAVLVPRILRVIGAALERARPDAVVVACNTASTLALAELRARFAVPFIGCVPPVKWAASLSRTRHIGVLATPATVRRAYLRDLAERFAADCTLHAHGSSTLAALAEARFRGETVPEAALRAELDCILSQPGAAAIDVMVLGCTHYGFLEAELAALVPPEVAWLDPAGPVARHTRTVVSGLAAVAGEARLAGTALFTAPPPDAVRLLPLLRPFGLERMEVLEG